MNNIILALAPDGAIEIVPLGGYKKFSELYERELMRFNKYESAIEYMRKICKYAVIQEVGKDFEVIEMKDCKTNAIWAGFISIDDANQYKDNMNQFLLLPGGFF